MLREYCQWDVFNASCPRGEVIVMESAQYGRMELGSCLLRDYGYVGCGVSVLPYVDSKCSGRRSCTINIPDPVLDKVQPCPGDLKSYLQASYSCIKGKVFNFRLSKIHKFEPIEISNEMIHSMQYKIN